MFSLARLSIIASALFFLVIACNGGEMRDEKVDFPSIKDVPTSSWKKLSEKKIYFGHQSVGYNIIEGIKDLMRENPQIRLNIIETSSPSDFNAPLFAHSRIGENKNAASKIADFASLMDKGIGDNADFAFMKLCFVDVFPDTDVEKVFSEYKRTMSQLKKRFAETTFIHVTVPLTYNLTGIKAWIRKTKDFVKRIIGKPVYKNLDNSRRNRLNRRIRQEYGGREPVFDIAEIQSTHPDGSRCCVKRNDKTYYSMVPEYTYDGGHLNETGRKKVAAQLLILRANLSK